MTLAETYGFLRQMHRSAPFLFFNGNTFAEMGRQLSAVLFSDLTPLLLREVSSASALDAYPHHLRRLHHHARWEIALAAHGQDLSRLRPTRAKLRLRV